MRSYSRFEMVCYGGKIVPKHPFRAFVYGVKNEKKLANSWEEFSQLITSGLWKAEKQIDAIEVPSKSVEKFEKPKHKERKK